MSESKYDSYPPLFRPIGGATDYSIAASGDEQLYGGGHSSVDVDDPLPVVDFHNIDHEKLGEACRDWGMFRLVNHGIPATLLNKLDDHAKKIFSMSFDSKQDMFTAGAPISYFWGTPGLTPSGKALQNLQQPPRKYNLLEGFHITCSGLSNSVYQNVMADYFRTLLEEYENHLVGTATKIFEALALNLNLDATQTKTYLSAETTGQFRVQRYPCHFDDHQAWGIDTHTDSTVLTILHQDEVGGLQLLSKDDKWFDVQPVPDSLIINLGDVMQAMSDDNYMAPKHRVKVHKGKERISVGYFVFPYDDTVIKSSKYKPFTYPDYRAQVQQDLKTVGYKIGLPKFKLVDNI